MDALLAYNVVVDECFEFSITMLLNSTIMLVIVLHYASICSYASILLLCSKLCQHNSPRPNGWMARKWSYARATAWPSSKFSSGLSIVLQLANNVWKRCIYIMQSELSEKINVFRCFSLAAGVYVPRI